QTLSAVTHPDPRIVPDAKWPGMYRIRLPDGLTDMVNRARAKDACEAAFAGSERRKRGRQPLERFQSRNPTAGTKAGVIGQSLCAERTTKPDAWQKKMPSRVAARTRQKDQSCEYSTSARDCAQQIST